MLKIRRVGVVWPKNDPLSRFAPRGGVNSILGFQIEVSMAILRYLYLG